MPYESFLDNARLERCKERLAEMTRQDIDPIVTQLAHALEDNMSPHYALGYLRVTLVDASMALPLSTRETHVRWLKQALTKELEIAQDRKEVA